MISFSQSSIIPKILAISVTTTMVFGCHSGYEEKDGKMYHKWIHGGRWSKEYTLMEKADPNTFETIHHDLNIDLGKDDEHVYKDASILENADPHTFTQVTEYYWKDKNYVFLLQFGGHNCIIQNADPKTFKVLGEFHWAKDDQNIFHEFKTIDIADSEELEVINEDWGRSQSHYYCGHHRLDSIDYKSAEIVKAKFMDDPEQYSYYIKDDKSVFYQNTRVKGADPKTFVADGIGSFGHDKTYMYSGASNRGKITPEYRNTYMIKTSD